MIKLFFTERAEYEVMQAALFYEQRQQGLGEKFEKELKRSIDLILLNPLLGRQIQKGFRRVLLSRFPFSIIYSFHQETLKILAVYHSKRRPFLGH